MTTPTGDQDDSYIDYESFLDPSFSPSSFANTLVLTTNNANDIPLDLSTPLSRVLFDIQEIDSHIDRLTSTSALPLISHTQTQTSSSSRIVAEVDSQIKTLNDSYKQLEREVILKHAEAESVRLVAGRLWETLRLGRAVARALTLGRQLEVQHGELTGAGEKDKGRKKEDHRALVRAAGTLLQLRSLLDPDTSPSNAENLSLSRVDAIATLRKTTVDPIDRSVRETSEKIVREFSISSTATFDQIELTRSRTVSALTALYLLSPIPNPSKEQKWTPDLMLSALETYLRTQLQSSTAGLGRALGALQALDRSLGEVSARCQNVVALEAVLSGARCPEHPLVGMGESWKEKGHTTLLQPLLAYLETGSLASWFWRSMAGNLASTVRGIVAKGGMGARALRTNRSSVGESIRECVVRGSQLPSGMGVVKGKGREGEEKKRWERESAVMVKPIQTRLAKFLFTILRHIKAPPTGPNTLTTLIATVPGLARVARDIALLALGLVPLTFNPFPGTGALEKGHGIRVNHAAKTITPDRCADCDHVLGGGKRSKAMWDGLTFVARPKVVWCADCVTQAGGRKGKHGVNDGPNKAETPAAEAAGELVPFKVSDSENEGEE